MGAALTLLALVVRLAWVLLVPTRPVGDFAMYVESARYLVAHGSLPPEFIYMPGYVLVAAGIYALGGGLTAIKLIGVASGGVASAAVYGTANVLFGRRAAFVAGLCFALWPAGIAVCSVTGTDMPAAALLALAVYLLVRRSEERPLGAAAAFGLVLGLAAYVRAVALPLAALSALHFRARGASVGQTLGRTALACAMAVLVLLPWGLRNRHLYGEFFLTDSHGGHTALVGANPNSEGTYSRSLNRQFTETTGMSLFAPPFRQADRAAYALAKQWTAFEPAYALGLLVAKADRLLGGERALLYWPLYRQSVLPPGGWFDRHRAAIERLVDIFWYLLIAAFAVGLVATSSRRNWPALTILPMPLGLAALYILFFAEVRYQLAIVVLSLPFAGAGVVWLAEGLRAPWSGGVRRARIGREAVAAALLVLLIFLGWPRLMASGAALRDRHRWAVSICSVERVKRLCAFRASEPVPGRGPSPVRGVWDGFGLRTLAPRVSAVAEIDTPPGDTRISLRVESSAPVAYPESAEVELLADGVVLARSRWPGIAVGITLSGTAHHTSEKMRLAVRADVEKWSNLDGDKTLWISAIEVESDRR